MHKKGLKFALVVELTKLNFTYITVLKLAKAGSGFSDRSEHPSVQINSSTPWHNGRSFFEIILSYHIMSNLMVSPTFGWEIETEFSGLPRVGCRLARITLLWG